MKFEIDPNELTTEQRNHVSDFIRNWPDVGCSAESRVTAPTVLITEEQRLDVEQKADLREFSGPDEVQAADNLNAIFGQPVPQVPLDKEGLPWDSRIHSSSKAFIADGTWKLRRGVDPAEVAKVKGQLRELMAVPPLVTFTPAPIVPEGFTRVPGYEPAADSTAPISEDVEWGLKSDGIPRSHYLIDQSPVPTPPAPKSHYLIDQQPTVTLTDLISRISKAIAENRITQATVTEVCLKHRVSEFALLSNRPDLLPVIDADMKALGV